MARRKRKNGRKNDTQAKLRRKEVAIKTNKEQQSRVDKLAIARDLYGKGSREGLQVQNQINKIFGIDKRHDVSNAPTAKQMRIAKAGRSEIVAGMKAQKTGIMDIASKVINKESDKKRKSRYRLRQRRQKK